MCVRVAPIVSFSRKSQTYTWIKGWWIWIGVLKIQSEVVWRNNVFRKLHPRCLGKNSICNGISRKTRTCFFHSLENKFMDLGSAWEALNRSKNCLEKSIHRSWPTRVLFSCCHYASLEKWRSLENQDLTSGHRFGTTVGSIFLNFRKMVSYSYGSSKSSGLERSGRTEWPFSTMVELLEIHKTLEFRRLTPLKF